MATWSRANPTNAILYVTQVPVPYEQNSGIITQQFTGIGAVFGNHRGDTLFAPRGGALMIRYPNGTVSNVTSGAGYGGGQGPLAVAVRQPSMHWSGTKALFSMVVGAPTNAASSTNESYVWQIYEITNLLQGQQAQITLVPNQPTNCNNISPCYGTDDRIIFTSDRARDGSAHLYPQLDEYFDQPIVSGIWSLDPMTGDLFLLEHSPSGAYTPFVDSAGRLIFTKWDHLTRDRQAVTDTFTGDQQTFNGTFNFTNESPNSVAGLLPETYPEPRNFDTNATAAAGVNGNAFNEFQPWMIDEDGSEEETLNHVGRHELIARIASSFTNDPNLIFLTGMTNRFAVNTNQINNLYVSGEDPVVTGLFYGIDAPDIGTHGAGQIVTLTGGAGVNPSNMLVNYLTPRSTSSPTNGLPGSAAVGHTGFYRSPVRLTDGSLICIHTTNRALVVNTGTAANPGTAFDFRLKLLTPAGGFYQPVSNLTAGVTTSLTYFAGGQAITYTGALWELDPCEVVARSRPARRVATVPGIEQSVFLNEGVNLADFRAYLTSNNLALIVSRNITTRDRNDRQQPFNLRVPGGASTIVTNSNTNFTYDIQHFQVMEADQLRAVSNQPGRRVLATPLHDAPNPPSVLPGATMIAPDGSQATFVPARRAVTWHMVGSNTASLFGLAASPTMSVVKERYWLSFAPGEIRTCTSCHGLNNADQTAHVGAPTNQPQALTSLLRYWKTQMKYGRIQSISGLPSGTSLNVSGVPLFTNLVAFSTNLFDWSIIATNAGSSNGLFQAVDGEATNDGARFYRVEIP